MAVAVEFTYDEPLRCRAVHGPSGAALATDAPVDNHGQGQHFSPTDLLGVALGTCMLTTMAIWGQRHGISLAGARGQVVKHMGTTPRRHIARLAVGLTLPAAIAPEHRAGLERAAHGCPVSASLGADTAVELRIDYA